MIVASIPMGLSGCFTKSNLSLTCSPAFKHTHDVSYVGYSLISCNMTHLHSTRDKDKDRAALPAAVRLNLYSLK